MLRPPVAMPTAIAPQGRPVPYFNQPDYKLHEFNKKLLLKNQNSDPFSWDELVAEFFEDDATLTVQFLEGDSPRKYTIHRRLIPRYFRSLYDGGVAKVYYVIFDTKENFVNTTVTVECKNAAMVTHYLKPVETKVSTEGTLTIEFSYDEPMRIRHWNFHITNHQEFVPKHILAGMEQSKAADEVTRNITDSGVAPHTLNYLKNCVILEPMQELMSRCKSYNIPPRDALKRYLFERWQARMMGQDFNQQDRTNWTASQNEKPARPPAKRRKRKAASTSEVKTSTAGSTTTSKKRPPSASTFPPISTSDVMLVGEPTLMGGKFGDEDERIITRMENNQFSNSSNGLSTEVVDESFGSRVTSPIALPLPTLSPQTPQQSGSQASTPTLQPSGMTWPPVDSIKTEDIASTLNEA